MTNLLIGTVLGLILIGGGVAQAHPVEGDGGAVVVDEIEEPLNLDTVHDADQLAEKLGCPEDTVPVLVLGDVVPWDDPRVPVGDNLYWATDYGLAGEHFCVPADDLT